MAPDTRAIELMEGGTKPGSVDAPDGSPSPPASFRSTNRAGQNGLTSDVSLQEQSPAYKALTEAGLIVNKYRLEDAEQLDVVPGNSTIGANMLKRGLAYCGLIIGGVIHDCVMRQFTVRSGTIRPATHQDGSYFFYGPGVHRVFGYFVSLGTPQNLSQARIEHGNCAIITVEQGFVGLAFDRGQPILLAPGMHQWRSDTLQMHTFIDLKENVIRIGPFTLITVDEGYAAITQDNGKQRVLGGGATHMLTHRNWKFEKFISLKINTDDLGPFRATTADNVVLETVATVNWRVEDPTLAAKMAADTMLSDQQAVGATLLQGASSTPTLRKDVLKMAVASLAAAVGSIRYADDVHIAASGKVTVIDEKEKAKASASTTTMTSQPVEDEYTGVARIFSLQQMSSAVQHANEICSKYGVSVISINVISAVPVDRTLEGALSAGAVAAAEAQQAEIAARGNAKAKLISMQSEAEALRINAQARADAERVEAQGKKDAAKLLEASDVAVDLARLEKAGALIGDRASFFFGSTPQAIPALLSNPKVTG